MRYSTPKAYQNQSDDPPLPDRGFKAKIEMEKRNIDFVAAGGGRYWD